MMFKQSFLPRKVCRPPFSAGLLAILLLLLTQPVLAQQRVLTGVVTGEDNSTLPGVSIVAKGTSLGTVTDAAGKFTISVPEDTETLVFTFVGMKTKEVQVGA